MKKHVIYWLAFSLILVTGCQKELSFELSGNPAEGSLQADVTGDCNPKTVNGVYGPGIALVPTTNTVVIQVNVTKTGTYTVGTDTVNGYYFRATGSFTTLGATNVTLRGNGTPFAAGVNNFVVSFDSTFCDLQVTVTTPAAFTLVSGGTPANCASAIVTGAYIKDVDLVPANNYVDITVNVTTVGAYSIRATGGGMTFQKSAVFTVTGNQTVRLDGTGKPTTVGANTITFDAPFTSCNFTVTVGTPVTGTLGGQPGACTPVTINGTYTQGTPMTAANTVQVQITTSAVGPYSVTTNTVAGMSFSASGTSTGAPQLITLNSNLGTPTANGPQTFTVTFGTSTCTFTITVSAPAVSAFVADCSTAIPNGLYETNLQLNCSNTVDIDINVTSLGAYNITTTAVNGMTFSKSGTFTMLGNQTITLQGSGTPGPTSGTYNITMPGTTPCTFPIFVDVPFDLIDWKFTVTNAPATTYAGQMDDAQLIPNPPGAAMGFIGSNSISSDAFSLLLSDANGTITVGETYRTSDLPTGNFAAFSYDIPSSCVDTYTADPSTAGVSMTFTITAHDPVGMTISGTFSGTAKNAAGGTMTITNGTFRTSAAGYHL